MKGIAVGIVAIFLLGGGYYFFSQQDDAAEESNTGIEEGDSIVEENGDAMMEKEEDGAMEEKDGGMMEEEKKDVMSEDVSFSGTVLAGSQSPLLEFNKSDYEEALASGKIITLYFFADWCPKCRNEFPKMQAAFDDLTTDRIVGFRVNWRDSQDTEEEQELAREFGVSSQHTKVFLKNGERVLKTPEIWSEERFSDELSVLLQD